MKIATGQTLGSIYQPDRAVKPENRIIWEAVAFPSWKNFKAGRDPV